MINVRRSGCVRCMEIGWIVGCGLEVCVLLSLDELDWGVLLVVVLGFEGRGDGDGDVFVLWGGDDLDVDGEVFVVG